MNWLFLRRGALALGLKAFCSNFSLPDLLSVVLKKKIITNSFFLMFICQNVGNLKGFLLVYLH